VAEQARAEGVTSLLLSAFKAADPSKNRGSEVKAREVLDQAAQTLLKGNVEAGTDAELTRTMLQVYASLGLYNESTQLWEHGLKVAEKLPASERKVQLMQDIANAQGTNARPAERRQSYELAKATIAQLPSVSRLLEVQQLMLEEAIASESGDASSIEKAKLAFEITQTDPAARPLLARAMAYYVNRLQNRRQIELANQILTQGLPQVVAIDLRAAIELRMSLVQVQLQRRQFELALAEIGRIRAEIQTAYSSNLGLELNLQRTESMIVWRQGDQERAILLGRKAIESARTYSGGQPNGNLFRALLNLAEWLNEVGKYDEAEPYATEALAIARAIWPKMQPNTGYMLDVYSRILANQHHLEMAAAYAREAIDILEASAKNLPPGIGRIGAMSVLIEYHLSRGETAAALKYLKVVSPLLDTPDLLRSVIFRIRKFQHQTHFESFSP
jgi:tetratricopeptide (TPR) repeat protein